MSDPRCAGTSDGHACIALNIQVEPSLRASTTHALKGTVHWALYKAGDVSFLGPGTNKSVYGGSIPDVDLSESDAVETVVIPNATAESYQILGYFAVVGDGDATTAVSGDPVVLPCDPVPIADNMMTEVSLMFDFIR
jgi:hypothetical protein